MKKRLEETEGPDMKEQMQDQIRQWFIESRYSYVCMNIQCVLINMCFFLPMLHNIKKAAIIACSSGLLEVIAVTWSPQTLAKEPVHSANVISPAQT